MLHHHAEVPAKLVLCLRHSVDFALPLLFLKQQDLQPLGDLGLLLEINVFYYHQILYQKMRLGDT